MWAGGHDINEHGESVLLLQPIHDISEQEYSRVSKLRSASSSKKTSLCNPSSSHIGGYPSYHRNDHRLQQTQQEQKHQPKCSRCQEPMYLLLQLHCPLDELNRTLYVFGCNGSSCRSLSSSSKHPLVASNNNDGCGEKNNDGDKNKCTNKFYSCFGCEINGCNNGAMIRCFRSQEGYNDERSGDGMTSSKSHEINNVKPKVSSNLEDNDWGDDGDDSDSCWGTDNGEDQDNSDDWGFNKNSKSKGMISMDDLEAMVTYNEQKQQQQRNQHNKEEKKQLSTLVSKKLNIAMDTNSAKVADDRTQPINKSKDGSNDIRSNNIPAFDCYELEMIDEPIGDRKKSSKANYDDDSDDSEDDDGLSDRIDANKVNKMISRYLEMEEDEEILSALKGNGSGSGSSSGGGKSGGESYERLSPEERAFGAFSKRLKRAPRQVVRYAYGGVPLWSIPLPIKQQARQKTNESNERGKKLKKKETSITITKSNISAAYPTIPPCVCGAQRVFEFQLLPSLLHVLNVDGEVSSLSDMESVLSSGGMNWGSIAVYSCPNSCDDSREEFLVVQRSLDEGGSGTPARRYGSGKTDGDDDSDCEHD